MVRSWAGALAERDFRLFFTGYLTSYFGSQMVPVAVTFAVLNSGGTAADVGYVLAAETVPLVVFLLVGGVIADRLPRRAVMIGADLLRTVSQGLLAALLLTGRPALWEFMVLLAVTGAGQAFFTPAMTGLIPQVVSAARLQQANALNGLSQSLGAVAGPAISGVLVAAVGPGWAVAADAATYLVSAYCLARVSVPLVTGMAALFPYAAPMALLAVRAPVAAVAAGSFVAGWGLSTFLVLWDTTMQREIPPAVLSRISAYDWFGSVTLLPVGYAITGPLAALLTVTGALWTAAGWTVMSTALVLVVPGVWRLRAPKPAPAPGPGRAVRSRPCRRASWG
jgi:Na+/melibiose symporter-like transporter